jgi:hypothetical protein
MLVENMLVFIILFLRENLIGIILMQDLLVNGPADKLPLRRVHGYFKRKIAKCTVDNRLERMFEKFRATHTRFT